MIEEHTMTTAAPEAEEQTESVRDVFARLYSDGRAYADAEIDRQKQRAGIAGAGIRDAIIFGAAGVMIIFSAIVALLVGLILIIAPRMGPAWATAIVFGSALILALTLLMLARSRVNRMKKAIRS